MGAHTNSEKLQAFSPDNPTMSLPGVDVGGEYYVRILFQVRINVVGTWHIYLNADGAQAGP